LGVIFLNEPIEDSVNDTRIGIFESVSQDLREVITPEGVRPILVQVLLPAHVNERLQHSKSKAWRQDAGFKYGYGGAKQTVWHSETAVLLIPRTYYGWVGP
jgi:hypothetical protein